MSAIAQAWVAKIIVGNQTAKQLLQFYASHGYDEFFFKNETLVQQLECSESSIQRAHKLLIDQGRIIKLERFDKNGRQLTNCYKLNIPEEFREQFYDQYPPDKGITNPDQPVDNSLKGEGVNSGGGCQPDTPRGVTLTGGGCQPDTPYNNKLYNNKLNKNKSSYDDQKLNKPVDNSEPPPRQPDRQMKNEWKAIQEHELRKKKELEMQRFYDSPFTQEQRQRSTSAIKSIRQILA